MSKFKTSFAENIFRNKYALTSAQCWEEKARSIVLDVCGKGYYNQYNHILLSKEEIDYLIKIISEFKFLPGGRYIYYAGRKARFYNNCYLLKAEEDSREEWAALNGRVTSCLMTGGGIGVDYSILRPEGHLLSKTGGQSSGPIPLMYIVNEIGRNVMQGGSRRSAIYASLNWKHQDAEKFLHVKDWETMPVGSGLTLKEVKQSNFNFPCPLDMTNISLNYDNNFLKEIGTLAKDKFESFILDPVKLPDTFVENVKQALRSAEPGFSFNFYHQENETLRNACVPFETRILTETGYEQIGKLINREIKVWNGVRFSTVTPFSTGIKDLFKVCLSDGTSLVCTDNHKWILCEDIKETKDLVIGDKLKKFSMPVVENGEVYEIDPYSQGFYSAEGNTDYRWSWVYNTKYSVIDRLKGKFSKEDNYNRIRWIHGRMFKKDFVPINGNKNYCLNWLAGLLDGDGTVSRYKNSCSLSISSINLEFLKETRLMLTRLGVQAKINKMRSSGVGIQGYFCQDCYRLLINTSDTSLLIRSGLVLSRLNVDKIDPNRDARQFVSVVSIEYFGEGDTYCFTESELHQGTFEGIVTGNCTEVTSEDDSDVLTFSTLH